MFNRKINSLILSSIFIFGVCISGCAVTPSMGYNLQLKQGPPKNVSLAVRDFTDARPQQERGVLGGTYNGYNSRMGDVKEPANLIKHIQAGFEKELANAGYRIDSRNGELVLSGSIEHISCDVGVKNNAMVYVRLQLLDSGKEILNQLYKGEFEIGGMFNNDMTCSNSLNGAIEKLIVGFAKDFNGYMES